jgi:cytochrome c5
LKYLYHSLRNVNFLQEKAVEATKQKEEKRKNLSPRTRKACHSVSTALHSLQRKQWNPRAQKGNEGSNIV